VGRFWHRNAWQWQGRRETKAGEGKLVDRCAYPLTGLACVSRVYTDLAVIDLGSVGPTVVEMCGGIDLAQLQAVTALPLRLR
jgi:3-oxoadipate CoA-transferase, beta subunit